MIAHSFFKIFVSKFIACELTSLFVWVFTPAHFSETLFSFQGTTFAWSFTSDSFYIISNSFVLCQELFWIYFFAFKFLTWRQLNILPEVFLSCKLFLKYFLFLFACLLLFRFLSKATLLIYLIWKKLSTSFWQEIKRRPRLTQSSSNSFLLQISSGCQTRTDDILINSQALYQLS